MNDMTPAGIGHNNPLPYDPEVAAALDPMRMGADYYLGEVAAFMRGYEMAEVTA